MQPRGGLWAVSRNGSLIPECERRIAETLVPDSIRRARSALRQVLSGVPCVELIMGSGFTHRSYGSRTLPVLVVQVASVGISTAERREQLPAHLDGFPLWLEEPEPIVSCGAWVLRPKVRGGVWVRRKGGDSHGTLGCMVRCGERTFGLTCEHVLNNPSHPGQRGDPVEWAEPTESGIAWRTMGTIAGFGGINFVTGAAPADSALVTVEAPYSARIRRVGRIRAEYIDEYIAVALRLAVQKSGAASGLTLGRVQGIMDIRIQLQDSNFHTHRFVCSDYLEVLYEGKSLFCRNGDSGSLVVDAGNSGRPRALGLLCSTVLEYKGYVQPIGKVLKLHGIEIEE